jgi:glyoxylase-like metal-dependent hydrolase (beta-lactamase superfamily II)
MRINQTGKIVDGFFAVGNSGVPLYLLGGSVPVLFDAGFTALARAYEKDIKNILGGRSPAYLFLTHAHFDHVGAAGYLKSVWPEMQICGSERAGDILARNGAVKLIRELNEEAGQLIRTWGVDSVYEAPFEPFALDIILPPDATVKLGKEYTVRALSTPGHTWDFMSYWVPEKEILVASEAVGTDDGSGRIVTEFLVDYDAYCSSIEKLTRLDPQILCLGHRFILTGQDARRHISNSRRQASEYVTMVERLLLDEKGNIERTVKRIKAEEWDPRPSPKQPEPAYLLNTRARVKNIWERMHKRGTGTES